MITLALLDFLKTIQIQILLITENSLSQNKRKFKHHLIVLLIPLNSVLLQSGLQVEFFGGIQNGLEMF